MTQQSSFGQHVPQSAFRGIPVPRAALAVLLLFDLFAALFSWWLPLGMLLLVAVVVIAAKYLRDEAKAVKAQAQSVYQAYGSSGTVDKNGLWTWLKTAVSLPLWALLVFAVVALPLVWTLFKIGVVLAIIALIVGAIVCGVIYASKKGWLG